MEKIFLRLLIQTDITKKYLNWFKDPKVTEFLEIDGSTLTKKIVQEYIKKGKNEKSYYMYAICLSKTGEHIGNLKIGPINHKHNFSDLVTVIGERKYWGMGLASESIKKGIKIAFEKYKIRKLSAGIYSENIGSIKAYTNAGFFVEGTLKKQFKKNGNYQDKIIVGCFNPEFIDYDLIKKL